MACVTGATCADIELSNVRMVADSGGLDPTPGYEVVLLKLCLLVAEAVFAEFEVPVAFVFAALFSRECDE